jgi:SAM-dependent methyltransferase
MSWTDMSEWWLAELEADPAYETVVTPMLFEIFDPDPRGIYLDLGCGEGRVMAAVLDRGAEVHGVEISAELAAQAGRVAPTVVGRLPDLRYLRSDVYDGAYCVLVLEHLTDHRAFFTETARVVKPGGSLSLVLNHPVWTAPGSTPISDADGEVLWRPGDYLSPGHSKEPAGDGTVVFYHRPMGMLLNAAADAGWSLRQLTEIPHHELKDQVGIPQLMASRWSLLP